MLFKRIYNSFSFRLAFLSLMVFLSAMLILRYSIYHSAVSEAEGGVKSIVEGQLMEVTDAINKHGTEYGLNIISSMIDNDREKMFVIIFTGVRGNILEGNLKAWPEVAPVDDKWVQFELDPELVDTNRDGVVDDNDEEGEPRLFLGTIKNYPKGSKLLVAYDIRHVENIRNLLLTVLWQNILLAVAAAIFCSAIITLIISSRLRLLNKTCEDVMEGKMDERVHLTGSDDEFDRLGSNFNSMLSWINRLIANTKDTTDSLAHDMRTPLNRHRIRLEEILKDPATRDSTKEKVMEAVKEVDRVVEMFDSILSISKAEGRSAISDFKEFDLRELTDDLLDLYSAVAEQKGISVTSEVPDKIMFKGERQLFAQALMNLLDNAIKYTPEGGAVKFSVVENSDETRIVVSDTGEGIPQEFHEKVRERFYRLDKSRTTSGSGLGLSLVDAVVKLHGGEMSFANLDPGLVVTLVFSK